MFFFFKQKTAYEMRISDWSSDVCSSDLDRGGVREQRDALAFERSQKRRVGEQAVDTEVNSHAASGAPSVSAKKSGGWKSGLPGGCASAHKLLVPSSSSISAVSAHFAPLSGKIPGSARNASHKHAF